MKYTIIFGFIALLLGASTFAFFSHQNESQKTPKNPQIFYDNNGTFIYTGGELSTLSGANEFFNKKTAITDIKTLKSELHFSPRFYIEYPNFSEIQNIEILSSIRKEIINTGNKDSSLGISAIGYHASFSLAEGKNIGTIIYEIFRDTEEETKKVGIYTFLLDKNGKLIPPTLLINPKKTTELTKDILASFMASFPEITPYSLEIIQQNLIAKLQTGNFAFSGQNVIFYLDTEIFTENSEQTEKHVMLAIPYETIQDKILTELPRPEIKKTQHKQEIGKSNDGKKYVALTFDDGPHKDYTQRLLNILKEKNTPATFFVLGQNAERYPEIIQKISEEGHEIGSHSWNHASFKKISKKEMRNQITQTDFVIKNAIGEDTKMFRPPYGAYDATVEKTVDKPLIMWSVDSMDWKNRNVEKNLRTTMSQVHDGAIILFHDIHKPSVDTIPTLIDKLRAQGYEFLTVSELYKKYYEDGSLLPGQVCFSMNRCK